MAWQLIYTSAPRLLEAGRSGFGTVARHRAIHPLLVTAIERDSQFDRSAGGVVLAHRILTAGGSRFHVLTSIRDAGADYTGRTNHIAHHLVIEPREIAALGSAAPTPAEVLAQMNWLPVWTDSPRWLDGTDEIPFSRFHRRPGGASAWQSATGEAPRAALLQPAHAACLILPPGADALALISESLGRAPAQSWQATFTTSLQPGDESADFRWVAIPAAAPMRANAESGRTVLDLTAPHTLPIPAAPISESAEAQSTPRNAGELFVPVPAPLGTAPVKMGSLFDEKLAAVAPRPAIRSRAALWVSLVALAAALVAGVIFFILPMLGESSEITKQRDKIRAAMNTAFNGESREAAALGDGPKEKLNAAESLADAVRETAEELSNAALTPRRKQANAGARTDAKQADLNLPPAINQLFDFHAAFVNHASDLQEASAEKIAELKKLAADKSNDPPGKLAEAYRLKFNARLAGREKEITPRQLPHAVAVAAVDPVRPPPVKTPDIPPPIAMPEAVPIGKRFEGELMILSDKKAWSSFAFKLRTTDGELRWYKPGSAEGVKLVKGGKGYRVGVGEVVLNAGEKDDELTPTAQTIPPYELVIQKVEKRLVTAWVPETNEPLRKVQGGVNRDGHKFRISNSEANALAGLAAGRDWRPQLELPSVCSILPGELLRVPVTADGTADAVHYIEGIEARIRTEEALLEKTKTTPTLADEALKNVNAHAAPPKQDGKGNGNKKDKEPPVTTTITHLVDPRDPKKLGEHLQSYGSSGVYESLWNAGRDLIALAAGKELVVELRGTASALDQTITKASRLEGGKNAEEKKKLEDERQGRLASLKSLKALIEALLVEQKLRVEADANAKRAQLELSRLRENPLAKCDKLPPGEYRLLVHMAENTVPITLVHFKIP